MIGAGSLVVKARLADGRLTAPVVTLLRPPVTRLFTMQPVDTVRGLITRLYLLCGRAQLACFETALAEAGGEAAESARLPDHHALWVELLHERLWRVLLDWPAAVGMAACQAEFGAWRRSRDEPPVMFAARSAELFESVVMPLAEALWPRLDGAQGALPAPAALPEPASPATTVAQLGGPEAPLVSPAESPAAAFAETLEAIRLALRAVTEGWPYPLNGARDTAGEGAAWARTLTSRGVLQHRLTLTGALVSHYVIEAPTDALFADAGTVAAQLSRLAPADLAQARSLLHQRVLALNPCVPFRVFVDDA